MNGFINILPHLLRQFQTFSLKHFFFSSLAQWSVKVFLLLLLEMIVHHFLNLLTPDLPLGLTSTVKGYTLFLIWLSVQQLKCIIYSEHFRGGAKFCFIIMLKMWKLYKFYYSLDYLKNLHSHNILFQFCNGSHFLWYF